MLKTTFKSILNDEELTDIDTVKSYLLFSFKNRRPKKDYKLYINICKIYNLYPKTIMELLNNIPSLGYYKDYFYILMFSRNVTLDDHIYDIVIDQLHQDLNNLKNKQPISTIGKWLPRENSKINKQCNFIDKFNKLFYPNATDKFNARRRYRKLKTMLNNKLGTLEAKMCTKQYSEIDFNKVAPMALKRNTNALMKHDECVVKLDSFETNTLKKMSLSEFTKELLENKHPVNKMITLWEHNRFRTEIPYIDKVITNAICIIDLSKDTFGNNGENFTFGIALLVDHFSVLDKRIIICNDNVIKLDGNVVDKAQQLLKYVGPCKPIDIEKYYTLVMSKNESCKSLIFVTTRDIKNIEFLGDKKMTLLQFMPYKDSYDIVHYAGDKIRKFKKYEHRTFDDNVNIFEEKKIINVIVDDSYEFKNMHSHLYLIFVLMLILSGLRLYEFLFI